MNQRNNDSSIMNQTLTRAGFVRSLTMGAAGAAVLAMAGKARAGTPPGSLPSLAISVLTLLGSKPDLPGTADVMAFMDAAYPTELSADDALLLRGALYLKADRLVRGVDALGIDAVTNVLASPLGTNPLSPLCFTSILDETRAHAASDPRFAASVRAAAKLADEVTATPGLPQSTDCWFPIIFGIILVVLIIVILLE
jgi:hypothetical protein